MHILSLALDILLACYIAWEVLKFHPRYKKLKQSIADGDPDARLRIYREGLVFEWITALLALLAIRFDWSQLNPKSLDLGALPMIRAFTSNADLDRGMIGGVLFGVAFGTIVFFVARIRSNRRGGAPATEKPSPWRKLLPDFSALVPVTGRERLLWAAVAISAGVCEEVVFRGWLLSTLHGSVGLAGMALLLVAAALFGLAHTYQGITGVIATALAGLFFCVLYVTTGSLLVPILLHCLIDVRFAFLPSPTQKPRAVYA
jgi:membrane protease YdiL (CAAX protease family)